MRESHDKLIAQTKHLRLIDRNGWSFVERPVGIGVVCIVPVTREGQVVLIEQYRPPVAGQVIELPAGLAGDIAGEEGESLEQAARRELLEETGFGGGSWERMAAVTSSPGLTNEMVTIFIATDVEKQAAGGGDGSEEITVHIVPLGEIDSWLAVAAESGKIINAKVYSGLYLLAQRERGSR
ncbi:MAG: NUDIX hydrolase [Planctomycetes bacterium]|nr:NUDIX hydrolase [Planctomycetota bacterium]